MEQKNGDIVRRSTLNYCYGTPTELALLNRLWPLVNLRKTLFLPTKKAIGYRLNSAGRHTRDYDAPRTPADRVKDTGVMLPSDRQTMVETYAATDLAKMTKELNNIQRELIRLAALKTRSQARIVCEISRAFLMRHAVLIWRAH